MSEVQMMDSITEEQVLDKITQVFQSHSYDAINTDQISSETGISAAELRQRFPDGKKQMVDAILARSDKHFSQYILHSLTLKKDPIQRILEMTERLKTYYLNGFGSCLFETLSIGNSQEEFKVHVTRSFTNWCNALIAVACDSGFSNAEAKERAEQALVNIEGSLVFARITGNNTPFQRSLDKLPCLLTGSRC